MKNCLLLAAALLLVSACSTTHQNKEVKTASISGNVLESEADNLKLGVFSLSLNVKDLEKSRDFYESLGFEKSGGGMEKNYLIMKNGNTLIGLFYGMFEGQILTFNPGWDENASEIEDFDDVRVIEKHLKSEGIKLDLETDQSTSGPASIMLKDPDGNVILIDQHR